MGMSCCRFTACVFGRMEFHSRRHRHRPCRMHIGGLTACSVLSYVPLFCCLHCVPRSNKTLSNGEKHWQRQGRALAAGSVVDEIMLMEKGPFAIALVRSLHAHNRIQRILMLMHRDPTKQSSVWLSDGKNERQMLICAAPCCVIHSSLCFVFLVLCMAYRVHIKNKAEKQ